MISTPVPPIVSPERRSTRRNDSVVVWRHGDCCFQPSFQTTRLRYASFYACSFKVFELTIIKSQSRSVQCSAVQCSAVQCSDGEIVIAELDLLIEKRKRSKDTRPGSFLAAQLHLRSIPQKRGALGPCQRLAGVSHHV